MMCVQLMMRIIIFVHSDQPDNSEAELEHEYDDVISEDVSLTVKLHTSMLP